MIKYAITLSFLLVGSYALTHSSASYASDLEPLPSVSFDRNSEIATLSQRYAELLDRQNEIVANVLGEGLTETSKEELETIANVINNGQCSAMFALMQLKKRKDWEAAFPLSQISLTFAEKQEEIDLDKVLSTLVEGSLRITEHKLNLEKIEYKARELDDLLLKRYLLKQNCK